ncbi:MAG: hypothetical protein QM796_03865 [Chthoniobacteraceae bacterium]
MKIRAERDQQQDEFDAFVKKNNMAFWDDQNKTAAKFLSDLKTQKANAANELLRLQTLTSDQLLTTPTSTTASDPAGCERHRRSGPGRPDGQRSRHRLPEGPAGTGPGGSALPAPQ